MKTLTYRPFWIIWTFKGSNPTVQHNTDLEATTEAGRLALANPGQTFYVMKAIKAYLVPGLLQITFNKEAVIPASRMEG